MRAFQQSKDRLMQIRSPLIMSTSRLPPRLNHPLPPPLQHPRQFPRCCLRPHLPASPRRRQAFRALQHQHQHRHKHSCRSVLKRRRKPVLLCQQALKLASVLAPRWSALLPLLPVVSFYGDRGRRRRRATSNGLRTWSMVRRMYRKTTL